MDEEQKQSTQPLYEFVAEDGYPDSGDSSGMEAEGSEAMGKANPYASPMPSDEEIRRGLIYPPPPSFYQNMQVVSDPPGEEQRRYNREPLPQPSLSTDTRNIRNPQPGTEYYHASDPSYIPTPPVTAPKAKRSRAWIWIVVVTLSVALLVSCGLCGWGMYAIISPTFQQVEEPLSLTQNYYSALQAKNYSLAYSYLSPQGPISGLSLDEFTQQANTRDSQLGPVRSYTLGQPSFTTTTSAGTSNVEVSSATITVTVKRSQQSYAALLTLQKIGGKWKIVDFDRL